MVQNNNDRLKPYSRKDLETLICEVMGIKSITPMINNQITKYSLEYGMSFKEIARCIVYYVEVQGKELSCMYGLGMIPNIRELANQYFKQLELDQQRKEKEAEKVIEYQDNNIIFHIKSLKLNTKKPKQLDLNDIKVGDEE